jgi:hypothetical protein
MEEEPISPFTIMAADKLAAAVSKLVRRGILDARSEAADKLLDYASIRFGDRNPVGDLEERVATYK